MVRARPIRFHLMGLVFASVIPVLLFGVIVAVLFGRQHRASLEGSLRDTARALTVAVDHELISSLSTLQALVASEHLDTGDLRLFYESAQRVLRAHQGWRTINLFDRTGQHLLSLLQPFGTPLPSSEIHTGVRQTLDTGAPAVSDLFVGTVTQVPTVAVTVPVIHAGTLACNRSGCQNLTLAIKTLPVVPSGYGNASRITARALGPDPTRSPGLYSGAGSACGDHGFHGLHLTGAGPHVTGTAEPNLTEFLTSTFERLATAQTARSPSEASPSRRTTRSPWPYSYPHPWRRSR